MIVILVNIVGGAAAVDDGNESTERIYHVDVAGDDGVDAHAMLWP